jgi:hypothetical protein
MTKKVRRPAAKPETFSEKDLKSLKALFKTYGADPIETELKRIAQGPPLKEAGAPTKIHPMSYVAVYLDIEERKVTRDGKARRRVLSVSEACGELAGVLSTLTADVRYASKSLQAMYREGRKLREHDPASPAVFITLGRSSDGYQVRVPFISTEITSDGSVRGPQIDLFGRGGRD